MTQGKAETKHQVPLEVYERLANATPEEKTDIVLRLIEEHPFGLLELPMRDGMRADLSQVDLSHDTLKDRYGARLARESPPWWGTDGEGTNLWYANLQGAKLEQANLQGARMWSTNLQHAILREADLQGADLDDAKLIGAHLRDANLQATVLTYANLQDAVLWGAKLQGAKLEQANLLDADLDNANLQGARLWGANLQGTSLWETDLQSADLRYAKLQGVDLSNCNVTHIWMSEAWLDKTRLRRQQLGGAIGEELDGEYGEAKQGYLALKQNFDNLGDYEAASWAYIKERQMEKAASAPWCARWFYGEAQLGDTWEDVVGTEKLQPHLPHWHPRVFWFYARHTTKWLADWAVELMCGYGEKIWRTIVTILLTLVVFGVIYWCLDGITVEGQSAPTFWDYVIFTLGALTTAEPGGAEAKTDTVRVLMTFQAFIGIALTGLLGFVVGNRIRRS